MNEDCPSKKVVIEDLLRVKRAERPPAEFWSRFERELRAKQLAAIVEKRAWWHTLPERFRGLSRVHLPIGATAILAITLMTVHEYRAPSSNDEGLAISSESVRATAAVEHASTLKALPSASVVASSLPELRASASSDQSMVPSNPSASESSEARDGLAESSSSLGLGAAADLMPSLSDSRSVDAPLVASLGVSSGFESRALPARSQVTDPLSQVATPKSVRLRDRYLGGALSAGYSFDSAAASPDRSVTRLRDRQLRPEEFSRFDARGSSLSIKL